MEMIRLLAQENTPGIPDTPVDWGGIGCLCLLVVIFAVAFLWDSRK
jgi:hypothetical protein